MTVSDAPLWRLMVARPGLGLQAVCDLPVNGAPFHQTGTVDDLTVEVTLTPEKGLTRFVAEASTTHPLGQGCFLALEGRAGEGGKVWTYVGPVDHREVFRSSPHDQTQHNLHRLIKQAVPMVAIQRAGGLSVALRISNPGMTCVPLKRTT